MATNTLARLRHGTTARTLISALLTFTLVPSAALAQNFVYAPGYTGYDASVMAFIGFLRFPNRGIKPLPVGTEFRVQFYSVADPVAVSGYASVAVNAVDPALSCPGVVLNQSMPGPNAPGEAVLLDMRCSLTSTLAPGKFVEVNFTTGFAGCRNDPSRATRPVYWLGRVSVALPSGYVDEQPNNDTASIPWGTHSLPPCNV